MAGEFVTQMLTDAGKTGVDVPDLKKAAEANGLTWITITRAKSDLGNIVAKKREGVAHGPWYWVIGEDHGCNDENDL